MNSEKLNALSSADSLADKGKMYFNQARFEQARDFYKEALDKRSSALETPDPLVAQTHHDLGRCEGELGDFSASTKNFEKAIELYESFYYDAHYALAPVLLHQASFLMRQDKWEEAEPICLRAQQIFSKTLSGEHKLCLESAYRLAIIYRKVAKNADALKLFVRIKKVIDSPLGPREEFKYLEALIHQDEGKPNEAESSFLEAIKGFEERRNLARLADCLGSYSELLKSQGKDEAADKILEKAKTVEENAIGLSFCGEIFTTTLIKA